MPKPAASLRELARVRADNRVLLNAVVGNQGTALGRKNYSGRGDPTGDPCVIVYLPQKIHDRLLPDGVRVPPVLSSADGRLEAPTDVVVTAHLDSTKDSGDLDVENKALVRRLQWIDGTLDHIPSGAQVGFGAWEDEDLEGFVGTIGYVVRSTRPGEENVIGVLTNQHVGVRAGHALYLPGFDQQAVRVGLTRRVAEYVTDTEWLSGVSESHAFVRTDAAFVEVEPHLRGLLRNEWPIPGGAFGAPRRLDLDTMDAIGLPVRKVGRTTGLQSGAIVAFGYGITSDFEHIDRAAGRASPHYYTDFVIAPRHAERAFSGGGDSGAAILTDDGTNSPVGLLWGGWPEDIGRGRTVEEVTYGIDLRRVLREMELELHGHP